jgi:deoxyribodipyrimidine photo-lyase
VTVFVPTRAEGLRRLAAFLPASGRHYADNRNTDGGPAARGNVSLLSPYLRYRLLTEDEVIAAALAHHGPIAAGKFVQEVAWRTYWKGWLELRPAVWRRFLAERDAPRASSLVHEAAQAEAGATGIEGFDDWARELVQHGYLHNHARMWFASIWIFTLRLPWALGADFFLRHLLDADPASNTLSWRWVAGLQTPGKTYLATADNIARYTAGRYRPQGLARRAEALTESALPPARMPPPLPDGGGKPALLLVTPEDLCPERMWTGSDVRAGLAVQGVPGWPWGDAAGSFVRGAVADAADRAEAALGCRVAVANELEVGMVVEAANAAGAEAVVTAYAPVGPVADALDALGDALAASGLPLVRVRRRWDERLWPFATKGFFAFREHLPAQMP